MEDARLGKLARVHSRLSIPVLVVPLIVYAVAWSWDPYVYGFSVLGLAPLQLGWAVAGLLFSSLGAGGVSRARTLWLGCALVASAVGAWLALKSIHWA